MSHTIALDDSSFGETVESSTAGLVLVDFWAPWCGPCRVVGPMIEAVAEAYAGRVRVAKVDVDESPRTSGEYGIRSIPTMILFRDGQPVDGFIGAVPRAKITALLDSYLAGRHRQLV